MPFGFTHKPLVKLASSAICSFFSQIEVYGTENVPEKGPIIFACTHVNMAVDPALLSSTLPHGHMVHYWVKDSLFKNPIAAKILYNAGNIAVDRKNKNNQKLFRGTFEALALGECIGVFPEGTSHTEPHIIALKDGTAWAALEYLRYLHGTEENQGTKDGKPAIIIPVGICYLDKSKYRSRVAVYYGEPITMEPYAKTFINGDEVARKECVKRLTRKIGMDVKRFTVNATNWDTSYAALIAKEILWEKDSDLKLKDYLDVAQTLVDIFEMNTEPVKALREKLVAYHRLLVSSRLSNEVLADLPLSQDLDPNRALTIPNRLLPLWLLIKDTISSLIRIPFFLVPMLFYAPIYFAGTMGARLVEDELETQAQMKIALSLVFSFLMYPVLFFSFYAVFRQAPLGAAIAIGVIWLIKRVHSSFIDENYNAAKRLVAAWRVLIGVWWPREMPLPSFLASSTLFAPNPPKIAGLPKDVQPEKYKRPKHLPSRVLVRHVLRTRLEAARDLASFLFELEEENEQVNASFWLAEKYNGEVLKVSKENEALVEWERPMPEGRRSGREVVKFLREKGARLGFMSQNGAFGR